MTTPFYVFPPAGTTAGTLSHDTGGWMLTGVSGTHPSGRPALVFDVPTTTPDGNGAHLQLLKGTKTLLDLRGVLYLHLPTGIGLVADDFTAIKTTTTLPRLVASGEFLAQQDT